MYIESGIFGLALIAGIFFKLEVETLTNFFCLELKVPLPKRNEHSVAELVQWAKENEAQLNNVCAAEFSGYDYGLQASDKIEEGSVVVSVPKKLMITVDCIKDSPMGKCAWDVNK